VSFYCGHGRGRLHLSECCRLCESDRKGEQPTEHLEGYTGWMHADGYPGFNDLYRSGRIQGKSRFGGRLPKERETFGIFALTAGPAEGRTP